MQNCDHNIGFREKRKFFRQKLAKIAEISDHNIDPWTNARFHDSCGVNIATPFQFCRIRGLVNVLFAENFTPHHLAQLIRFGLAEADQLQLRRARSAQAAGKRTD
jgi:hypothetical protein